MVQGCELRFDIGSKIRYVDCDMKNLLFVFSLLLLVSCSNTPNDQQDADMINFIEKQLVELLDKPADSFLIVNIKDTPNYVQFAGSRSEDLFFDFPTMQLNEDQLIQATDYFQSMHTAAENIPMNDGLGSGATINTFTKTFGKDTSSAAELAAEVLQQVFNVTSPDQIELDWS